MIGAHVRGDDAIALDPRPQAGDVPRPAATARLDAMGFPRPDRHERGGRDRAGRFSFLSQLDDLLRDQERQGRGCPPGGRSPGRAATPPPGSRP